MGTHVRNVQLVVTGIGVLFKLGEVKADVLARSDRRTGHFLGDQGGCLLEVHRRGQHLGKLTGQAGVGPEPVRDPDVPVLGVGIGDLRARDCRFAARCLPETVDQVVIGCRRDVPVADPGGEIPLTRREWMAIAAMAVGMGVFLLSLRPTVGHPGEVGALGWMLGTGLAGLVVGGLVLIGRLLGSARGAALFGIGSGTCFALTAVFMFSALTAGFGWAILTRRRRTWCRWQGSWGGVVLLQLGLQAGTLVTVQPGVSLVDPVVAIVLGVTMFTEQVRDRGWIAVELLGACAVGWGTFVLSRSEIAASGGASGQDPYVLGCSD